MVAKRSKYIFWGIIVLIILMIAAVFVPMMTMRGTMADTVEQLNDKYKDDFTMTWTSIDDTPMSDTFIAIVKSNNTGITYDAVVTDGDAVIPYELENLNAKINEATEKEVPNSFALAESNEDTLFLRVLVTSVIEDATLNNLVTMLKEQFEFSEVTIETVQVTKEQFDIASEHIDSYYQRSTVTHEAFAEYKPVVKKQTF